MAKKTVRVTAPGNTEELTETVTTMLTRNDGAPPAVPTAAALVLEFANRVGVGITINPVGTPPPVPTPAPGTGLIPTNLIAPLRALYPELARDVLALVQLNTMAEALSTSVVTRLGIADGQTNENSGTVRAILARIIPVLKSLLAGNENEIESYGLHVVLGTASSGGGTPTPTPAPTPAP